MAATASEGTVDTTLVKRGSSITTCCHELVLLQYSHTRDYRHGLAGKPGLLRGCLGTLFRSGWGQVSWLFAFEGVGVLGGVRRVVAG